jgi:hypothetical protein
MDKETIKQPARPETPQQIPLLMPPDASKGVYSNVALIHHTRNEFVVDFLLQFGGQAQLVSRVIMSPNHAKAFRDALRDNIEKYETASQDSGNG